MFYKKLFFIFIFFVLFFYNLNASPVINSFQIISEDTISAGDTITFIVKGTGGAKVWVMLSGSVKIYLPEISPGVYEGLYNVASNIPSVYNTIVFAHLQFNGVNATPLPSGEKITILGSTPLFRDLMPADETTVTDLRPQIYARIDGRGFTIDKASIKMVLNGDNVTGKAEIKSDSISFKPSGNLKEEKNIVYLYGKSTDGKDFSVEWIFYLKKDPSITSVSHNGGDKALSKGKVLEVRLTGEPYQKAYFDIGDFKKGIVMNESFKSPGTYIGNYIVKNGDYVVDAVITGYLDMGNNKVLSFKAPGPVTLMSSNLVAVIVDPQEGQEVKSPFTVQGQTRPMTVVYVDVQLVFNIPGVGKVPSSGVISGKVRANEMGFFEYEVDLENIPSGSEYTITVSAMDAQGNKSSPFSVKVKQK